VIDDVTLPTFNGTTQIDQIVVSPYGVFVIEVKNMSGWIFGRENQQYWTQVLYKRKYKFFNPIKQNQHHIRTVQSLFGLHSGQVEVIVVFTGSATFKTGVPRNVVVGVRRLNDLIRSRTEHLLPDGEVIRIFNGINDRRLKPGRETDLAHVRYAKERARKRSSGCPRCGGQMVERTNRATGEKFMGCNRYPRCRGTRPLS